MSTNGKPNWERREFRRNNFGSAANKTQIRFQGGNTTTLRWTKKSQINHSNYDNRKEERDQKFAFSQAKRRQRNEANLCFRCRDKCEPGHKYKVGFPMMEDDKEEVQKRGNEEDSDVIEELDLGDEELVMNVDLPFFLMAGVSGNATLNYMAVLHTEESQSL